MGLDPVDPSRDDDAEEFLFRNNEHGSMHVLCIMLKKKKMPSL
jgi:hypothetical protein